MGNDEWPVEFRRYISLLVQYHQGTTKTWDYRLKCRYEDKPTDTVQNGQSVRAEISIYTDYLSATIRITKNLLNDWKEKNYEEIARDILHELSHIIIEPIVELTYSNSNKKEREIARQRMEQTVEKLSRAFHNILPNNYFTPEYLDTWAKRNDIETPYDEDQIRATSSVPEYTD